MMKNACIRLIKKETVFVIAGLLALISMLFVPPDGRYLDYIDTHVLFMLFSLMLVVAGLRNIGLFRWLGQKLIKKASHTRTLYLILVLLCFFSSMLITNDVALLTFVPFGIQILQMAGKQKKLIFVIVMQTIAANLGSMLTPIGNPQNLYLHGLTGMGAGEFILLMLPLTATSLAALCLILMSGKNESVELAVPTKSDAGEEQAFHLGGKGILYIILFLVCMLAVAKVIPAWLMALCVALPLAVTDRRLFARADYFLLGTFVFFFLFIGNMQRMEGVSGLLNRIINGRELYTAIAASQVISNVPAAILLSGFTGNYRALLLGTNIGGLGTLIASLASLISYKLYVETENAKKGSYFLQFTLWNVLFLILLTVEAVFL